MAIYIDPHDDLHTDYQGIALTCPHCQTLSHMSATGVPKFETLSRSRPRDIGIVFRCDACSEPVFLKFPVKAYTDIRIELGSNYVEIERARETFPLTYLPEQTEVLFKEALQCYASGHLQAFAAMCRRTAQSLFHELGEIGKLELFDTLQDIRVLAELDEDTFGVLRGVIFGTDADPWTHQPWVDSQSAGILLEVMKDLLYQTFVRKSRLQQAMTVRRYLGPMTATGAGSKAIS